jgi:hypothetical protein
MLLYTVGSCLVEVRTSMRTPLARTLLFALYQMTVAASIMLLPLAIMTRQAGFTLPAHRAVNRLEQAYDATT